MVICGSKPPLVIAILDCTDHIMNGGKKDAEFIISFSAPKVNGLDPWKTITDFCFFGGTEKVQKAGQILCTYFL